MRKFFQRLDNSSRNTAQNDYQRENLGHSGSGVTASGTHSGGSFIGKIFSIGQYTCTVEEIIAEGGFALVFLVKAQGNLGRFALKRLFVNNEQDLENAKNEIEIAKKLGSHKNIVNLVESRINYCGNGVYEIFLLMDFCKGHLLQKMNDKLKEGSRFSESEVIQIFADLCEAIARIHLLEPPVIHRDLKIENILINENGTYQVCDFGSATSKILSASSTTQTTLEIEEEIKRYTTLSYRAPEMIDVYSGKSITTKSDIWALGCCLFKICFFQMPFGESTLAIQNAHLTIPDDKFNDYSTKLLSLIAFMLNPDPDLRPDIFQVSQLAFKLADKKCPIVNIKAKVFVPDWEDLKVPPTESQAREIRKSLSGHNLQPINNQNSNTIESGMNIDPRTTSVTPRQRPKPSITLSAALPTSPVAFPSTGNSNRATTPCDLTSTVNTLTSGSGQNNQTSVQQPSSITVTIPPPPVPASKNESTTEYSSKVSREDSVKFSPTYDDATTTLSSTNPFLEHSEIIKNTFQSNSNIPPQLSPAQSLRNLSTQHDSIASGYGEGSSSTTASLHQHRRNLSDTSAFSQKNIKTFESDNNLMNSYSLQSSVNIPQPVSGSNSGTRSLNPFIDNVQGASFEDQQFGHEFDRIRQENHFQTVGTLVQGTDSSTSGSSIVIPSGQPTSEPIMAFTNNYDPFEAKNAAHLQTGILPKVSQPNEHSSVLAGVELQRPSANKHKQNTIIQITSGSAFVIQNDTNPLGHVIRPSPSSAFVAVVGSGASASGTASNLSTTNNSALTSAVSERIAQQMKHLTLNASTDKSISTSSQGQTNLTQAANYMPLYSSEESEKSSSDSDSDFSDDIPAPIAGSVHLGDDVLDNLIHDSSNDLTKPLVDENDDDEYEEDDEDEDDDDDSSIGSASDLQHSSSESNNSSDDSDDYDSDDLNSSKSLSRSDNSLSDHGKNEELNGFVVITSQHSQSRSETSTKDLPKTGQTGHYSQQQTPPTLVKPLTVSNQLEVNTTDGDGTSCSEILSTTSSMNLSAKVTQDNSNVTIDQLIGHIDANRPLLEEDDDPEDDSDAVRPMIEIDQEIEYIPPPQQQLATVPLPPGGVLHQPVPLHQPVLLPQLDSIITNEPAPIDMFSSMSSSTHSVIMAQTIGQDFDVISSTDSEENRKLDEEVEMSLTNQVLMDQMNRKDLFGSVPFTDKELVDKSIEQQNKIALQKTLSLERSVPLIPQPQSAHGPSGTNDDKTDLFGAVPFNSTEKMSTIAQAVVKPIKLDPPPQVLSSSFIKHCPSISGSVLPSSTSITKNPAKSLGKITVSNISSKSIPSVLSSQSISTSSVPVTTSRVQQSVTVIATGVQQKVETKSPIPSLKSVGKIKTKTARKYEVDESDEEVDGLLEAQDEEREIVVKKKTKKDAKKEKTDKKSKEKEDKKERKNREKLEKVKEKELKKKKKSKTTLVDERVDDNVEKCNSELMKDKPTDSKNKLKLKTELKALKVNKDKKKIAVANLGVEFGMKVDEKDYLDNDTTRASSVSGLISSTPIKGTNIDTESEKKAEKDSIKKKDKKEKKDKEKKSEKHKSTKKHQAFANMSFEDETTTSATSHIQTLSSTSSHLPLNTIKPAGDRELCLSSSMGTISTYSNATSLNPGGSGGGISLQVVGSSEDALLVSKPSGTQVSTSSACLTNTTNANITITRC